MRVMTMLGTRPEIIRLSQIIKKLDIWAERHILVHTGQNFDTTLSDLFFDQLQIRKPDYRVDLHAHSFGMQIGQMFPEVESILARERPDRILVLGDTNSALCAVLGERVGIPVYHMEAGNRCYDMTVPEEINRHIIDSIASFNLPYTSGSRENLLREGIKSHRIWVSGNPIFEVLQVYRPNIERSDILQRFQLQEQHYFVVTVHRAENVDSKARLEHIFEGLRRIAERYEWPVLISVHPRTKHRLRQFGIATTHRLLQLHEPLGLFDFVKLQSGAACVISDSGTVQEESCILHVPAVTIRQSTERPETVVCGSNMLAGVDATQIVDCVDVMVRSTRAWPCPEGYCDPDVSTKIVQFLIGGLSYV